MARITVERFLSINDKAGNDLKIRALTGQIGLDNKIASCNINRPGMNLFGYFKFFANDRVQIFGNGESSYLEELIERNAFAVIDEYLGYNLPLCVFTHGIIPPEKFIERAKSAGTPVFLSELATGDFIQIFTTLLDVEFAPMITMHGGFLEIFGVGVFIKGKSGVGKSEAALELIERGHRLIADDSVDFRRLHGNEVIGMSNRTLKYNMEVRGLGIVNIERLSGMSAIRDKKELELVITLEDWNENKEYDRIGLDDTLETILDVDFPSHTIPVKPGRNIYILIETAAKNHRLKQLGYHSAREFNKHIVKVFESGYTDMPF